MKFFQPFEVQSGTAVPINADYEQATKYRGR